ncbi:MAG: chromosome segregation protein SMC [Myxococcota bacterium]|nr:chromosome segregation protein SMC [Myxococcota bacterium]
MKIKKVELVGFKSFVDRTILRFDHDVLGIVGPNGCGKSNIVDAIRWCMGEQSARHLRGRSMEDVIFNGSESRSPHDFAEVTLTFENDTPGDVPLEYREYSELAVTRRLHRTGESDYLINKVAVRLRDVTDLFLGTGAGTKAYSIVEQGKVGLIVSAKPEDRRLLIEEAAGITKFKSRKRQAEKKMELTAQNLLRVGDIVAEIERNIASLKRQAAKAERYIAYRTELEDLQLHEASHRYLELVGWIKLERGEFDRFGAASSDARSELAVRDAELEVARLDVHAAEDALEQAQNENFAAENAVRGEEAAIQRSKDRLSSLARREEQAAGERNDTSAHASRLTIERENVAVEVSELESAERAQDARIAEEESKLGDFNGAHAVADARVTERRHAIAKAAADIASSDAKLAGLDRRRQEMAARLQRMTSDREALDASRCERMATAEAIAFSIEDLRAGRVTTAEEKARLEQRLNELKHEVHAQERALEDARGELSKKRSRHVALGEMHARLEGVDAGTRALMAKRDPCLAGLVADHVEAPAELTQALAGLLGARLRDVVVRDLERGVALLEELARGRQGRATIVPIHSPFVAGVSACLPESALASAPPGAVTRLADGLRFAPDDAGLVRALVGDALVVPDLACARRLRDDGVRVPLVTLDGAVVYADGRIAGGQGDAVAAGVLDSKREARELVKEIERLEAVVSCRVTALQGSRGEMAQIGASLDRARQEAHARDLALVTAEKDLQNAKTQLEAVTARLAALAAEKAELSRVEQEAIFERDEAARVLSEGRARIENAELELQDAEAALFEARDRLEAQRQAITACKVAIAGTRERLAAARGTAARLARSATELEERARRLEDELLANVHASDETRKEIATHEQNLKVALDESDRAKDALAGVRARFEAMRTGLLEREGALKELRARADTLREELQGHEIALRERELALQHLLEAVSEKFRGLQLAKVVGDYHMRPPPDEELRARIDELARLLERMGSVNLDAMREHADAQQRFDFYTVQKADLEKALADLTRAIQQMNRESRRLFEETFDAVNARFREVFPRMFRGGRAELRLTNPDDILETGIDIVAQPPGKKLSSIELMSGGEKALTAVSLIFAIFQIKPSPFCILDEVDAPLDEANVARYNDLVRSMTARSQFILITHVKRTMQLVDVLYGVTMPEPGVSKIVSVKINDASSHHVEQPQTAVA